MKLVRYEVADGSLRIGAVEDSQQQRARRAPWDSFDTLFAEPDPLAALHAEDPSDWPEDEIARYHAPTVRRPQVIAMGGNFPDHALEARSHGITPIEPIFLPFLWGAIAGPDEEIRIPAPDTQTDYEVEMCVVIGRTARRLTPRNALDHVFGYTIVNDVSARDVMAREKMQIMLSKCIDSFVPVGPSVVTRDEIADPDALDVATYVNGELKQKANTSEATWGVVELLVRLTQTVTLHPGDIVTIGTPGGSGVFRDPPEFMRPGDVVEVEVEGIGRLRNPVVKGW